MLSLSLPWPRLPAIPPAAQSAGGISITHGGGNVNTARGALSEADQSATTLGGIASGHGVAITNGGNNRNTALGALSFAGQNTTTVGGVAGGRGRAITTGGSNVNTARGFGQHGHAGDLDSWRHGFWTRHGADQRRLQQQPGGAVGFPRLTSRS